MEGRAQKDEEGTRRTGEEKGEEKREEKREGTGGRNQMAKSTTLTARAAVLISHEASAIMTWDEYTLRRLINPYLFEACLFFVSEVRAGNSGYKRNFQGNEIRIIFFFFCL